MRLVFSTYTYIVYHCLPTASVHQSSMSYPLSIYSPNFLVERLHSGSEINLESPYRVTVDETRRSEQINTRKWSGWAIINGNALNANTWQVAFACGGQNCCEPSRKLDAIWRAYCCLLIRACMRRAQSRATWMARSCCSCVCCVEGCD